MLLHLCLCVVALVHLTSSQLTYDVTQQENDVSSCGRSDPVLNRLAMSTSHLMTAVSRMEMSISQLVTNVSQLQSDVAELKALNQQTAITGIV